MTTHTRKAIKIEDLQAKHFIAWLRKQVRENGRHTVVGSIGDGGFSPLETWLMEVTGETSIFASSCESFTIGDGEYHWSQTFSDFSVSVLEGDPEREDWRGHHDINAWDMLNEVLCFMGDKETYIFEQEEQEVETYFDYALNTLSIDMDQNGTFALVPSESDANVSYRVDIDESRAADVHATSCRCDGHQLGKAYCKHMKIIDGLYGRILAPYNKVPTIKNDKAYADVIDDFYEVRGAEIATYKALTAEAKKRDEAPLNGHPTPVAPSAHGSSIERSMAARGWLK